MKLTGSVRRAGRSIECTVTVTPEFIIGVIDGAVRQRPTLLLQLQGAKRSDGDIAIVGFFSLAVATLGQTCPGLTCPKSSGIFGYA
jgi:hypothetical protein